MTPVLEALLWASVAGAGFAGLIWVLCRAARAMPAWVRCALWLLVSLKFLVHLLPVSPVALPVLPAPGRVAVAVQTVLAPAAAVPAAVPTPVAATAGEPAWVLLLASLWLLGMGAALGQVLRQQRALARTLRRASPLIDAQMEEVVEALVPERARGRISLWTSEEITAPLACGMLRPKIVLPAAMVRRLTGERLTQVLAHELSHHARLDLWTAWIPAAARIVFWFHPLAHLASSEYAHAREEACDAEALALTGGDPAGYGRLLLELGVARSREHAAIASGGSIHVEQLKRRLSMLAVSSSNRWSTALSVLLLCAAIPVALVPITAVALERDKAEYEKQEKAEKRARHTAHLQRDHDRFQYVLMMPDGSSTMSGNLSDLPEVKRYWRENGSKQVLWVKLDGRRYLITEPRILSAVWGAGEEQRALGEKQGKLGEEQGKLGEVQGELGAEQGKLGAEQGKLGARQARLSLKVARAGVDGSRDREAEQELRELEKQMQALGEAQSKLGEKQSALGEKQAALGEKQAALGEKQAEASRRAHEEIRRLIEQALSSGHARLLD